MKGLDWPSERYIRFYCRDTASWMVLGWEAQALYPQIRRKCDRAGVLDLGDELKSEALAAMLPKWPPEAVERGLEQLISKGWVDYNKRLNWLYLDDFEDSESAKMTSAQRSREHRSKLAAEKRIVASRDDTSQKGTRRDAAGHAGTRRDSVPSYPIPSHPVLTRSEEREEESTPEAGAPPLDEIETGDQSRCEDSDDIRRQIDARLPPGASPPSNLARGSRHNGIEQRPEGGDDSGHSGNNPSGLEAKVEGSRPSPATKGNRKPTAAQEISDLLGGLVARGVKDAHSLWAERLRCTIPSKRPNESRQAFQLRKLTKGLENGKTVTNCVDMLEAMANGGWSGFQWSYAVGNTATREAPKIPGKTYKRLN